MIDDFPLPPALNTCLTLLCGHYSPFLVVCLKFINKFCVSQKWRRFGIVTAWKLWTLGLQNFGSWKHFAVAIAFWGKKSEFESKPNSNRSFAAKCLRQVNDQKQFCIQMLQQPSHEGCHDGRKSNLQHATATLRGDFYPRRGCEGNSARKRLITLWGQLMNACAGR